MSDNDSIASNTSVNTVNYDLKDDMDKEATMKCNIIKLKNSNLFYYEYERLSFLNKEK